MSLKFNCFSMTTCLSGPVYTKPEKFEHATGFKSRVTPTVHANPPRKRNFRYLQTGEI